MDEQSRKKNKSKDRVKEKENEKNERQKKKEKTRNSSKKFDFLFFSSINWVIFVGRKQVFYISSLNWFNFDLVDFKDLNEEELFWGRRIFYGLIWVENQEYNLYKKSINFGLFIKKISFTVINSRNLIISWGK